MAIATSKALHGTTARSWQGNIAETPKRKDTKPGKESANAVSVQIKNSGSAATGTTVHVQWYKSSRCGWAHFGRKWEAEKVAKVCHGMNIGERILSVKFQKPSLGQRTSFSVWIGNIDESATPSLLRSKVEKLSKCQTLSVSLGELPFRDKSAAEIIQRLLREQGGPLTAFDCSPGNNRLKRKALAKFAFEADAKRVCEYFNQRKVPELGGSILFLKRVFVAKYSLPSTIAETLLKEILPTLKKHESARFSNHTNETKESTKTSISIQADDLATITLIRKEVDPILRGEVLRDPKNGSRIFWNNRQVSYHAFLNDLAQKHKST
jgi:hypothetical protein